MAASLFPHGIRVHPMIMAVADYEVCHRGGYEPAETIGEGPAQRARTAAAG